MSETLSEALGAGRIEQVPRKPKPPVLGVEVSYGMLGCYRYFDVVEVFEAVTSASERQAYWTTDLIEWGYDQEWERPLAYLLACDEPEIHFGLGGAGVLRDDTFDIDIDHVWVKARNNVDVDYKERDARNWCEADLDLLAAHVPWLAPGKVMSAEDLARMPGPLDSPMF